MIFPQESFVPQPLSKKMATLDQRKEAILNSIPSYQLNKDSFHPDDVHYFLSVSIPSYISTLRDHFANPDASVYEQDLEELLVQRSSEWIPLNTYIFSVFGLPPRNKWVCLDALMELHGTIDSVLRRRLYPIQESKRLLLP